VNRMILLIVFSVFGMSGAVIAQDAGHSLGVRYDDQRGLILTDNTGRTLYISSKDRPYESNCVGPCLAQWDPVRIEAGESTAPTGLPGEFGVTVRPDGSQQVCYNGRPLYLWRQDSAAGTSAHGQGKQWSVANVEPTVQLGVGPDNNTYLIGPDGMTLYAMATEGPGLGRCSGDCAKNWPPLVVARQPVAPEGLKGKLAVVKRPSPDNRLQVTYRGQPLYYWFRDRNPGDTLGNGIGGIWHTIKPMPIDQ
jgi:predicted lipoprotein with Yx(FWY)xxD motif